MEPNLDPSPIRFGRAVCDDLRLSERREWWLANGLGGYAAGTIAGTLTRRYHGLLIAPIDPPLGRRLVLAKADATLMVGNRTWPLFTNRWSGGAIDPRGLCNIESFHLDGTVPVWRYVVAGMAIEQRIWLEHGANTVYVAYRLVSSFPLVGQQPELRITLLANNRDHHGDTDVQGFTPRIASTGDTMAVEATGTTLTIMAIGGSIAPRHEWYRNFDLPIEAERGLGNRDHHLCVGEVCLPLQRDRATGIAASVGSLARVDLDLALARRHEHDAGVLRRAAPRFREPSAVPGWVARCALMADAYVFSRPLPTMAEGESIIAGYPWFGEWGRDTMIALPGLTLAIGRHDSARHILQSFTAFLDRGLLPNTFPGAGVTADYNSVDATLWFVEAWRAYVESTTDTGALAAAFPALVEAMRSYMAGTRYGIGVDPGDGLLRAGEAGVQVTWMDAKVGDRVVTPRIGKPVEVNALWYNALMAMAQFAKRLGKPETEYASAAALARQSFVRFVRPDGGVFDVIDGADGNDATIRPNQIIAASLPHRALDAPVQAAIVAECRRHLLTSYGLRSLAPGHKDYRGRYLGGVSERDGSYHQGPVWAWLLGPYAIAEYGVTGDVDAAQALLEPIGDHLTDAALGHVSEIFDGDPPHEPRGCPAQAWSIACILDAWVRLEKSRRPAADAAGCGAGTRARLETDA